MFGEAAGSNNVLYRGAFGLMLHIAFVFSVMFG